jgi:hypothetical protein
VPRFRMSAECEGAVVISAFLNQPIIPVGHHDFASAGVEVLSDVANKINSLGNVVWTNPASILGSNYLTMRTGSSLRIRPYSARFQIKIPAGVDTITIDPPVEIAGGSRFVSHLKSPAGNSTPPLTEPFLQVSSGQDWEFCSSHLGAVDYRNVPPPSPTVWGPVRRILCEARDRTIPLFARRRHSARTDGQVVSVSGRRG